MFLLSKIKISAELISGGLGDQEILFQELRKERCLLTIFIQCGALQIRVPLINGEEEVIL